MFSSTRWTFALVALPIVRLSTLLREARCTLFRPGIVDPDMPIESCTHFADPIVPVFQNMGSVFQPITLAVPCLG